MEIEEKEELDSRKYYLKEFQFFDGECDITNGKRDVTPKLLARSIFLYHT